MKRLSTHKKFSLVAFVAVVLTGCASTGSSNFSCPAPNTGMCKPIHDVDKMVSQGQVGQSSVTTGTSSVSASQTTGAFNNFSTPYPASVITPGAPLRIQEQVMAVWIAPYQDKQDNYHEPSTLYTVIKPGQWTANPVTAVDGDDSDEGAQDGE